MGRLRDGFDAPLWRDINEEVIDLFGNEDGILYYFDKCRSNGSVDPLYGEPAGTNPTYLKFKIPFIMQDWSTPIDVDETGKEVTYESIIFISRAHLDKAGVPKDAVGDQVRPGDVFEAWFQGDRIFWDIIGVDRQGFVNDSDYWTQYIITARRNDRFQPERWVS